MNNEYTCPRVCVTHKECEEYRSEFDKRLSDTELAMVRIQTLLKCVIAILSAIGVPVLAIAVNLLFK